MLASFPVKSLLMNYTDNAMFTVFYMRTVERFREDVLVMNTAGGEDIYGLESAPPWKYSGLFPDFYKSQKSKIEEISRDFAGKEKLFANTSGKLTKIISRNYNYYPYIFSVALYSKYMNMTGIEGFKKEMRDDFKLNYNKINYERVIELPFTEDFLLRELLNIYAFNTMLYADFIKRDGKEKEGTEFYEKAFLMGYPEQFLWPFIDFLLEDERKKEAFALINELKNAEGSYGELANLLEQKAISTIKVEKIDN
ncbi:MAG: hypothetical protein WC769_05935 [Thermodesulfovibrionales bacterium]